MIRGCVRRRWHRHPHRIHFGCHDYPDRCRHLTTTTMTTRTATIAARWLVDHWNRKNSNFLDKSNINHSHGIRRRSDYYNNNNNTFDDNNHVKGLREFHQFQSQQQRRKIAIYHPRAAASASSAAEAREVTSITAAAASFRERMKRQKRRRPISSSFSSSVSTKSEQHPSNIDSNDDSNDDEKKNNQKKPNKTIFLPLMYRYLQLELFTKDEIDGVFDRIRALRNHDNSSSTRSSGFDDDTSTTISMDDLEEFLYHRIQSLDIVSQTSNNNTIDTIQLQVAQRNHAKYEAKRIMSLLMDDTKNATPTISKKHFYNRIINIGTSIDIYNTIPIGISMLLVGSSVGIISPAMPFVIEQLQLSTTEYGVIVSAFALAKLCGNIPSTIAIEKYGRKQFMVYTLTPILSIAVAGIGIATSFHELIVCRIMAGFGVSALSAAGTLMITDLSTSLNRASTLAPIMSAFAAGTAIGPAMGGMLIDTYGIQSTFYLVGILFFNTGIVNHFLLSETKQSASMKFPWHTNATNNANIEMITHNGVPSSGSSTMSSSSSTTTTKKSTNVIYDAVNQWVPLLKNPTIRNVMIMNGMYWVALAGSQMTLLPLLLTATTTTAAATATTAVSVGATAATAASFGMNASQVGQVYMGMSCIQLIGNPIFAKISDHFGHAPSIIIGCTLIGTSMYVVPLTETIPQLAVSLSIWAMGSSMLSTAPIAYISDAVMIQQQQQQQQQNEQQKEQQPKQDEQQEDVNFHVNDSSKQQSTVHEQQLGNTVHDAGSSMAYTNTSSSSSSRSSHKHSTVGRAQAIALLRTFGDIGFLFGAAGIGALADYTNSVTVAMQCSSVMLLGATSWFATTKLSSIFSAAVVKNPPMTHTVAATTNRHNEAKAKQKT